MIDLWFKSQLIKQLGTPNSQQNKLGHFGCHICIVETVGYRLRNIIILGNIGGKKKKRSCIECLEIKVKYLHPYLMFVNSDLIFNAGIFKETVMLFHPVNLQGLILVARLVVITVFP